MDIEQKIGAIDLNWWILAALANVMIKKTFTKHALFRMTVMQK